MVSSLKNKLFEISKKTLHFLKSKSNSLIYFLLALVVFVAVFIRTRNLSGLRDVTTGGWTLGPDLDPFLFLRWAKYIVENGSLFQVDPLRYVPLGFNTGEEFPLLANLIALFHNKIAWIFGSSSVEQSAVIFPVFMFALTVIAFFFMTREAFNQLSGKKDASYIAIVASFFLSVIPAFIPRSIAGIPEKESVAFLFFFLTFYFFLLAFRQEKTRNGFIYSTISGISAGLMGLTWGGFAYILLILNAVALISFLLGQMNLRRTLYYLITISITHIIPFSFFENRFNIVSHVSSIEGMFTVITASVLLVNIIVHKKLSKYIPQKFRDYKKTTSIVISGLFLIVMSLILFGPEFIIGQIKNFYFQLVQPATSRLIQTVAENRQPFFVEWAPSFGPIVGKIALLVPIVFISSLVLIIKNLNKTNLSKSKKNLIVISWMIFVFTTALTRYKPESIFNGSSFISITFYLAGVVFLIGTFYYINKKEKSDFKELFENIHIGTVFVIAFFIIGLISARAFIRLVIILVPIASMLIGFIFVASARRLINSAKARNMLDAKNLVYIVLIIIILFAGYSNYLNSKALSQNYVPSAYTQQWQKSMAWVRENTPINSVFAHWWDYGYWVQSIGERATMLDGGNYIGYWNYLMGRNGLTESDQTKTLEFFYAHNITHFLIDSTDIGKYSAYSTIGSDPTYDRRSWIPTILKDPGQTSERKNTTILIYPAGASLDKDIKYNLNGTEIFLPEGKSYLAAVAVAVGIEGNIKELYGIYFMNNRTYQIPLRYYFEKDSGIIDLKTGIEAGVFIYPRISANSQGGIEVDRFGAMLYLSPKVVNTNLARLYLFGEQNSNFDLANSQPDAFVEFLNSQGANLGDFAFYNEFRGPIKIWDVKYPSGMKVKEEYLQTEYPSELLFA